MKTSIVYKAKDRGSANYGWLKAKYSFSFSNYHDPKKIHFGVLRVLNDDSIAAAMGFDTHSHDNMEIITIPLEGQIEHTDSMGNSALVRAGEVQVMSAGSGVSHSERNPSDTETLKLFQIWVFPNKKNVEPRYDQVSLQEIEKANEFYQILSPSPNDQGVWIHQDAWFHMGRFEPNTERIYTLKNKTNGVYLMVIDGELEIDGQFLSPRDAISFNDVEQVLVKSINKSYFLVMEVPMIQNNK